MDARGGNVALKVCLSNILLTYGLSFQRPMKRGGVGLALRTGKGAMWTAGRLAEAKLALNYKVTNV